METVVNVVAVVVAVVVILGTFAALWYLFEPRLITCDDECWLPNMSIIHGTIGSNWTLTVKNVTGSRYLEPSSVRMTIRYDNETVKMPMSSVPLTTMTPANWATYKVTFQKVNVGSKIGEGDVVFVDMASYPAGCRYEFHTNMNYVANGTF